MPGTFVATFRFRPFYYYKLLLNIKMKVNALLTTLSGLFRLADTSVQSIQNTSLSSYPDLLKRFVPLFAFLLCLVSGTALASTITVVSHRHDILLNFDGAPEFSDETIQTVSSGSGAGDVVRASIVVDNYLADGPVVEVLISPFKINIDTYNFEDVLTTAKVSAEWLFMANGKIRLDIDANLLIYFGGSGGSNQVQYSLSDNETLDILAASTFSNEPPAIYDGETINSQFYQRNVIDLSPGRTYKFTLKADTSSLDGTRLDVGAIFVAVPDDASTALLLAIGLAGLAIAGKKKQRNRVGLPVI
jgi:hypothetical protein